MPVNLKLLSVFVLVAEHSSFRKAAEELDRSQSVVSTQIRQLEEQLGVTLFHRTTRSVALSSEGEELLTHVRQALGDIQTSIQSIVDAAAARSGRVIFACAPTVAGSHLAPMLTAFKKQSPDVVVHVRELPTAEMLDSIQAKEVDFGIGPRVKRETGFRFQAVLSDEIWAVIPRDSVIEDDRGITLTELSRLPMLMITKSAAVHADLEQMLAEQHVTLDPHYEGMQVQTMLSLVGAGLGALILPRIAIPSTQDETYRAIPVRPAMTRDICIITLARKKSSPVAAEFIAVAERVLRATQPHA